jgi:hypothetical protein
MFLIESTLLMVLLAIALARPRLGSKFLDRTERSFSRLARRPVLSVALVGLAALALRLALLPILPVPEPIVHDEFGYLLIGDTFAHGRVTNPTHPMWMHFETFSVIQKPTYQCYTPPVQGVFLALGNLIAGHSFWGVWFSIGLMCSALCWMLQGWLPPGWALLGGVLAVLRWGVFDYWANSYWGGALGAIGGALVLGTLPRMMKLQRARHAITMGAGLTILANSRPYEGAVLSIPVAIAFLTWVFSKRGPALAVKFRRVVFPLCLTLAVGCTVTGYYFWRVTGSPLRSPYQVERETYSSLPYLIWQPLRPPPRYNHQVIQDAYADEVEGFKFNHSWPGLVAVPITRVVRIWRFYLGPALTLPLLMLAVVLPYGFGWRCISGQTRFLLLVALTFGVGAIGLEATLFSPHYAAPLACVMLALVLSAMRRLRDWQPRGKLVGLFMARATLAVCVVMFVIRCLAGPMHISLSQSHVPAWDQRGPNSFGRAAVARDLRQLPGDHLVIVHYKPEHNAFAEWVYNEPDIDAAKVVWARAMTPQKDEELIRYFHDRRVWLLEADQNPPKLEPYSLTASEDASERTSPPSSWE